MYKVSVLHLKENGIWYKNRPFESFLLLLSPLSLFQGVQGGRAKRYSSQRQRPVPEPPAPPVHISIMEGHYYDPREFFPYCWGTFFSRVK